MYSPKATNFLFVARLLDKYFLSFTNTNMKNFIHEIFPETFDYSDENCIKKAIKNYCTKNKINHLEKIIFEELKTIF